MTVTGLLVLLFAGFLKYFTEFGLEVGNVVLYDAPDNVVICRGVSMHQLIACGYDVSPLDIWVFLSDVFRDVCCSFADEKDVE